MSTEANVLSCPWSSDDDKLLHFASLLSRNWNRISIVMRKSDRKCYKRYVKLIRMISSKKIRVVCCYACTNRLVKNEPEVVQKWTESNDRALMRAVNIYGVKQWHKVGAVTGLSARCCEVRWKSGLNKVFADGIKEAILKKYGSEKYCNDELREGSSDDVNTSRDNNQKTIESTHVARGSFRYICPILFFIMFLLLCTLFTVSGLSY